MQRYHQDIIIVVPFVLPPNRGNDLPFVDEGGKLLIYFVQILIKINKKIAHHLKTPPQKRNILPCTAKRDFKKWQGARCVCDCRAGTAMTCKGVNLVLSILLTKSIILKPMKSIAVFPSRPDASQ